MYSRTKLHNHILNGLCSLVSNKVSFVARVFFPYTFKTFIYQNAVFLNLIIIIGYFEGV
jgi:hypothetical protein